MSIMPAGSIMPDIINISTEQVSTATLRAHPANPRQGDVGAVVESIKQNGFFGTLVVQRSTMHVLAGNHRLKAALALEMDAVPVCFVDVSDEAAMRILLADNRTSDLATYDEDALAQLLTHLASTDAGLTGTGYDGDALDDLLTDLARGGSPEDAPDAETSRAEELRETWGTEPGQLWLIPSGDGLRTHRLLCGDATSEADARRLLGGAVPELMITDPPYGVEYDPAWRREAGINKNDGKMGVVANDDRCDWREAWALFPGDVAYVWHAGKYSPEVAGSLESVGLEIAYQIIWSKDRFALSRGDYHYKHEPCWYAVRKGQAHRWAGARDQCTVWEIARADDGGHGHGTQKPLECMERPIRNHTGDIYEPFAGSGTTLVAAERQARTCYALELSPAYVAVILQRLSAMGLTPALADQAAVEFPA